MIAISVKDLTFKYKQRPHTILDQLSFDIEVGKITAILGASGSGKSTLCRCLCGLIPRVYSGEYSGHVQLFGESLNALTMAQIVTTVGIVFQNPETQLFSPTIEDELAFGPENLCIPWAEIHERMNRILKRLDMEAYRESNPQHLSGGQQQLIAFGAVLMMKPKIIICDEMMSWVDEVGKKRMKQILLDLKEEGTTIVLVDHDTGNTEIADHRICL